MKTVLLILTMCGALIVSIVSPGRSCFDVVVGQSEPDVTVEALSASVPYHALVIFDGLETDTIAVSDTCVVGLKQLSSISSINSVEVIVAGYPQSLFSFISDSGCAGEVGALLGGTATTFSSPPSQAVSVGQATVITFEVTLNAGSTYQDLESEVDSGTFLLQSRSPSGGSPIIGGGKKAQSSMRTDAGVSAPATCLSGTDDFAYASGIVTYVALAPTLSGWGLIVFVVVLLSLSVLLICRRRSIDERSH